MFDGEGGLKLHPGDGFTGDNIPTDPLSAERGELNVRSVLGSTNDPSQVLKYGYLQIKLLK